MNKKILVTGASGFIATHTIIELLNHGYQVRGTVRRMDNTSKDRTKAIRAMLTPHTPHIDQLEFVTATLDDADCWDAAVSGCDAIMHIASPVPIKQPKNPDEIVKPAREGTLHVLRAAQRAGVRRIILTSSEEAVSQRDDATTRPLTDQDWSDPNRHNISAYALSKTLSERAAWEFAKAHDVDLTSINPVLVLGPALEKDYGTSLEMLVALLSGKYPLIPKLGFSIVDVRDVASLQRIALESPASIGQRLLCSSEFRWFIDISKELIEQFPAYKRKLPTHSLPNFVVKLLAPFDPIIAFIIDSLEKRVEFDCSPATALGWAPRSSREAISAGAISLIDLGLV
jgi:dihydroflavonol-4-reductase